ncbi:DUF2277 domain-containing protein [Cellulomonas marina]|uniref:DUF2277 domain-containing protein n=1 Tax=Cellulomonas marina TaxID=988821 RepID=A0A1I0ZXB9_9CELL|nr:DUF2277 domain-containing protein [Cellulomonas marina]GIG30540.1 hypothetical protein Cma02nite_31400 [Cellulomonas marina]SFB29726.1 hypothetical protein SAMN05421867_11327 [Cellulomonas marina]
MCRNITTLRGLEPGATPAEIEAAALQYVRKVSGVTAISETTRPAVEAAVARIVAATTELLDTLPERRRPPATVPPLRRPEVVARIEARRAASV